MTTNLIISCRVGTTDASAPLGLEVWVDAQQFVNIDHVQGPQDLVIELPDDEANHELRFVMKNKTVEHTLVDDNNNIIKDASLSITDVAFDEIKLGHMLTELAVYTHNYNDTAGRVFDKFYGTLGCNGTVSLKFTTPLYIWLLEHL
jgi:hypothetical protein